jgi:biopolymer transport protein ExbB
MQNLELIVDYGILSLLGLMGFLTLYILIERLLFFKKVSIDNYKNKDKLELDLSFSLTLLANISANAPFVGLLGTVFGIMLTFYNLGQTDSVDIKIIMVGLALALKATALGLLVAIPSTLFYNQLIRKVEIILTQYSIKQDEA